MVFKIYMLLIAAEYVVYSAEDREYLRINYFMK
jgi:hypothetical protein